MTDKQDRRALLRTRLKQRSTGVEFKARMGFKGALTLGLGSLLGAGLYVLIGLGAAAAGPGLWLAYAVCGLLALPSALMYADLARHIPRSGGGYLYAYQRLGGFWGFFVGWLLAVGSVFACALYAIGLAAYAVGFFSAAWASSTMVSAVAMASIVALTSLALTGGDGGERMQGLLTWGSIGVLMLLVIGALFVADTDHISPHFPHGVSGIGSAISLIYISFFGYQLIATNAEEVVDPAKTVPRAMVVSLMVAFAIYVVATLAAVLAVPWQLLAQSDAPLVLVAASSMGGVGEALIGIGAILAAGGALNGTLVSNSRQIFAMGRDRMLPRRFGSVNVKTGAPTSALLIGAAATSLVIAVADLEFVAKAANFALLASLLPISFALHHLQKQLVADGEALSAWRRALPWLALASNLGLLMTLGIETLKVGGLLIGIGFGVFIAYSSESARRGKAGLSVNIGVSDEPGALLLTRGERILVPMANPSTHASLFTIATAMLPAMGGEIVALRVVLAGEGEALRETLRRHSEREDTVAGLDEAEQLASTHGATLRPVVRAARRLGQGIQDAARDEHCKLIVMGYNADDERSNELLEDVMTGSSAHVIMYAARARSQPQRAGYRVAVSIGGTANLSLMVRIAGALAENFSGRVTYMNIAQGTHNTEGLAHARTVQIEVLKRHTHAVPCDTEVIVSETPLEALIERSRDFDVLLVGSAGSMGPRFSGGRTSVGSFSSQVAQQAHCSVIVVRVTSSVKRLLGRG